MSITHTVATRNALANTTVDRIDLGTTNANGKLILLTSGDVVVATHNLANPACGNAANGTATYNAIASDTNAVGGTIAKFKIVDRDDVDVYYGGSVTTVGGGGDLELSSLNPAPGDTVQISSLAYTAPV